VPSSAPSRVVPGAGGDDMLRARLHNVNHRRFVCLMFSDIRLPRTPNTSAAASSNRKTEP